MASNVLVVLYLCCLSSQSFNSPDIDSTLVERIKVEVLPIYEKYQSQSAHLCETATFKVEMPGNPPKNKTMHFSTARIGFMSLMEKTTISDDNKDNPITEIHCANEDYHFSLVKQTPDSPYVLTGYAPNKPGELPLVSGSNFHTSAYHELGALLKAIEGKENHTLKTIRMDNTRQLVHARLERPASILHPKLLECELWMDPQNQWRILESTLTSAASISTEKLTYGQLLDGLSYPTEITTTTIPTDRRKPRFSVTNHLRVEKTTKQAADYRLTAFGLPEPVDFPAPKRRSTAIWLLLAALGTCILLAVGFRYLARRKRLTPIA